MGAVHHHPQSTSHLEDAGTVLHTFSFTISTKNVLPATSFSVTPEVRDNKRAYPNDYRKSSMTGRFLELQQSDRTWRIRYRRVPFENNDNIAACTALSMQLSSEVKCWVTILWQTDYRKNRTDVLKDWSSSRNWTRKSDILEWFEGCNDLLYRSNITPPHVPYI